MIEAKPFWKPGETGVVSWKTGENSWCVAASINFMPKTTVVNIRNTKDYDIYVGREVKNKYYNLQNHRFANPFILRAEKDRDKIYEMYENGMKFTYLDRRNVLIDWYLDELKGKRLACWCASKKCHADLLAKLADMTYQERWEWANSE